MNNINALGFIEVRGLTAGIEAADAMLKSAQVRLLRQYGIFPGLITLTVEGDLAACRAAVDAGVAAASRIGVVIASNIIARPDEDTETMVLDLIPGPPAPSGGHTPQAGPQAAPAPGRREAASPAGTKQPKHAAPAEAVKTPPAGEARASALPLKLDEGPDAPGEPGETDEVLAFIAKAARGRSWHEIVKQFPDNGQQLRKELDARVEAGELNKIGMRYRKL